MKTPESKTLENQLSQTVGAIQALPLLSLGIGVDVEELSDWNDRFDNKYFLEDNFSPQELDYCRKSHNPKASLAGRWCAKEAVLKAMSNFKPQEEIIRTFGETLGEITIIHSPVNCPLVQLFGKFEKWRTDKGIQEIKISISHTDDFAIAIAIAV